MLKVGVTGGIGAGKSIVCQVFQTLGIPVFNADDAAKGLLENDENIRNRVTELLGEKAYLNNKPDRKYIAYKVFNNEELLTGLNAIIHPATIAYGNTWMEQQDAAYIIKEAAIFFESGTDKGMDKMIGVSAPNELRIQRVMQRPGMTREEVQSRMQKQMLQSEKMKLCDYVIQNDDIQAIIPQVLSIHSKLLKQGVH